MNALGAYVQSVFANPMSAISSMLNSPAAISSGGANLTSNIAGGQASATAPSVGSSIGETTAVGFYFRGSLVPLVQLYQPMTPKPQL